VNRAELESKHLAELHSLAAKAGVERYRMLSRGELIERLADGDGGAGAQGGRERREPRRRPEGERRERQRRPRRERPEGAGRPKGEREKPSAEEERVAAAKTPPPGRERPRRRRRRRWGRRRREVRVQDLLAGGGGQAIVYADGPESCTELLREVAGEFAEGRGPDPIALLIDPSPEELADWKRDAPRAEIVSAGKAQHADDAVAAAVRRAEAGEEVTLLVDSLTRFAESFGGPDEARALFDSGRGVGGGGSLTIVAAIARSA
jgi:hypothetical protein